MHQAARDVEEIFHAALGLESPGARSAFLDRVCGDTDLRRRVERLLAVDALGGDFLEAPAAMPTVTDARDPRPVVEEPGTTVGPYKLLEVIGEGGMGTVYMADQAEPVRRRVALKVIKPGMDSKQVVARFEAERQALALMDHPNIARVLDGGVTPSGRPYFVMELVRGLPITDYCDQQQLPIAERLELFVLVCRAVQHAHQKGVIHRDLKPSNVLVTVVDGVGVPKVIDFGVAKATGGALTEKTLFTGFHQFVGTPLYVSPEQVELSGADVDTRSDIYSLGVLLYELLTGTTPFDPETLKRAAFDEMRRIIREEEPPKPSTRLSALGAARTTVSANRGADFRHLDRAVRGELDWIVMKALEKDRRRRYETANDFAADVTRYLTDQPVEACPPSARYRFAKFAQRNRATLTTASLIGLALFTGTALSVWQAVRAMRAERLATSRLHDFQQANAATTRALNQSEEERRKAEAVKEFLVEAFRKPDPYKDGRELKVVDLLDGAAKRLDDEFGGDPKIRGELLDALGHTYSGLGLYDRAVSIQERALSMRRATHGPDHQLTLNSQHDLAGGYAATGREAEALRLEEQTLELCGSKLGPNEPLTLASQELLARLYLNAGRTADGIRLMEQTVKQTVATQGPDHPNTLAGQVTLARAYEAAGRRADAIRLFEETLEIDQSKLGPDHLVTLGCQNCLAVAYMAAGRTADATPLFEQVLKMYAVKLGNDHPRTLLIQNNLASAYNAGGRTVDAVRLHEQTLALQAAKLGSDHASVLLSQNNLGFSYIDAGMADEAIELLERTLKLCESKLGPDHPNTLRTRGNRAAAYLAARRWAEAEPLFRDVLDRRRRESSADPKLIASALAGLGRCLLELDRATEAESMLRESLAIREKAPSDDWSRFEGMTLLGGSLLGQKKYTEAEPLLIQGYEGLKARETKIFGRARSNLAEASNRIIELYDAWGKKDKAAEWRVRLAPAATPADPNP